MLAEGLKRFGAQGYEAASIEQIAAGAGVARGTFYLYFPDKLALFDALARRFHQPLLDVLDDTSETLEGCASREQVLEAYQAMALGIALVGVGHQDELLMAFREARQPGEAGQRIRELERALIDRVVAFTEGVKGRGLLDVPDARVACLVVYGAVERLFYEVLHGEELGEPAELARQVLAMFARAMGL